MGYQGQGCAKDSIYNKKTRSKRAFLLVDAQGGLSTPKLRSQSTALKETDVIVIARSREPWIIRRFLAMIFHKKKHPQGVFFLGGRSGGLSTPKLRSQSTALKETDVIVIAHSREPWIIRRFLAMIFHKKKHPQGVFFLGGRSGTRSRRARRKIRQYKA